MKGQRLAPLAIAIALLHQVLVWFVWYPLAGYNDITRAIAQLVFVALGVLLLACSPIPVKRIGLGSLDLLKAMAGITLAYGVLLAALLILNAIGGQFQVFRQRYYPVAVLDNWVLTGLGEELFFAGVLFQALRRRMQGRASWWGVLITAALFALWHVPGYIAVALKTRQGSASILFQLLLNVVSWGFFGTIYLCSRNLWLTALAHASTDYALLPAVTNEPLLGLLFMGTLVVLSWWLGRMKQFFSSRS